MPALAGYSLLGRVGVGSSGVVWQARDTALGRLVAIKHLGTVTDLGLQQWRSEAQVLATLQHPNIVQIYAYAEDEAGAYIVEEWIDGAPLPAVLARGPLTRPQAMSVMRHVLLGLAFVHARGMAHGDVAPGNVMLERSGAAKLVDFGLARRHGANSASSGTRAYASPEAIAGRPFSAAGDVFSAAAVLAYLLRGYPTPSPTLDGVDAALRPILRIALAAEPHDRYPDAAAFLAALEDAAVRRYGAAWWSQAGLGGSVVAAPPLVIAGGEVDGAGVSGLVAATPETPIETIQSSELDVPDAARQTRTPSAEPAEGMPQPEPVRRPGRRRRLALLVLVPILVIGTVVAVAVSRRPHARRPVAVAVSPTPSGPVSPAPTSAAAPPPLRPASGATVTASGSVIIAYTVAGGCSAADRLTLNYRFAGNRVALSAGGSALRSAVAGTQQVVAPTTVVDCHNFTFPIRADAPASGHLDGTIGTSITLRADVSGGAPTGNPIGNRPDSAYVRIQATPIFHSRGLEPVGCAPSDRGCGLKADVLYQLAVPVTGRASCYGGSTPPLLPLIVRCNLSGSITLTVHTYGAGETPTPSAAANQNVQCPALTSQRPLSIVAVGTDCAEAHALVAAAASAGGRPFDRDGFSCAPVAGSAVIQRCVNAGRSVEITTR